MSSLTKLGFLARSLQVGYNRFNFAFLFSSFSSTIFLVMIIITKMLEMKKKKKKASRESTTRACVQFANYDDDLDGPTGQLDGATWWFVGALSVVDGRPERAQAHERYLSFSLTQAFGWSTLHN